MFYMNELHFCGNFFVTALHLCLLLTASSSMSDFVESLHDLGSFLILESFYWKKSNSLVIAPNTFLLMRAMAFIFTLCLKIN